MRTSLSEKEEVMVEEKKPASKQSKKPASPKKEAPKPAEVIKATKQKTSCRHSVHKHLGKGEIIEELVVNKKDCYKIKFENLKNNIVFKKQVIIKE
jgi:hypothetical protein